ncbi:hypothetical protein [Hymenobacter arizonensis]|uniref:Uncharacterized protein n=1 Tax=Hymenobacter arizonensis TaxID=1227077 RepID=A0A1I5ZAJ2_HYMAR|nr:hypothetical protein [Hymenobacter arizonensis]SFQ53501.1 hypothetical protein SAMN04515668_2882 [Hymenobacter arizonensis]
MRFHLPRRYRRKLLFPPGLLALAGLLWLGCLTVNLWQGKLSRKMIMQLVLLPKHLPLNQCNNYDAPQLMSVTELQAFRTWREASFLGNPVTDAREQERTIGLIQAMMADSAQDGGVRIRFASTARFKDLVFALDLMNREKVQKYRLDIHHGPVTLYAYTYARLRHIQYQTMESIY